MSRRQASSEKPTGSSTRRTSRSWSAAGKSPNRQAFVTRSERSSAAATSGTRPVLSSSKVARHLGGGHARLEVVEQRVVDAVDVGKARGVALLELEHPLEVGHEDDPVGGLAGPRPRLVAGGRGPRQIGGEVLRDAPRLVPVAPRDGAPGRAPSGSSLPPATSFSAASSSVPVRAAVNRSWWIVWTRAEQLGAVGAAARGHHHLVVPGQAHADRRRGPGSGRDARGARSGRVPRCATIAADVRTVPLLQARRPPRHPRRGRRQLVRRPLRRDLRPLGAVQGRADRLGHRRLRDRGRLGAAVLRLDRPARARPRARRPPPRDRDLADRPVVLRRPGPAVARLAHAGRGVLDRGRRPAGHRRGDRRLLPRRRAWPWARATCCTRPTSRATAHPARAAAPVAGWRR